MKTKKWVFGVLTLTLLWAFLQASLTFGALLSGVVLGFLAIYPFRKMYTGKLEPTNLVRALPHVFIYIVIFVKDVLVANIDVARRILAPSLPIDPKLVVVPLRVESDYAITTIANSITLTPGTLTMDYKEDENALYVHSISGKDIVEPIRTWEDYAINIFEGGDPPRSLEEVRKVSESEASTETESDQEVDK